MVSKKDLKSYEYNNMYDYYDYILISQVNGNFQQVNNLYNALSVKQQKEFILSTRNYFINMFQEQIIDKCLANCFNI